MKVLFLAYECDLSLIRSVSSYADQSNIHSIVLECALSTITNLRPNEQNEYLTLEEPFGIFVKNYISKSLPLDPWSELRVIEAKYLEPRKTIRQLMRTAQYYFQDHHTRKPYYRIRNDYLRCCLVLQIVKWFLKLISEFQPDVCFCFNGEYLVKQLAASFSNYFNYKYLCLTHSRLSNSMVLLDSSFKPVRIKTSFAHDYAASLKIPTTITSDELKSLIYSDIYSPIAQQRIHDVRRLSPVLRAIRVFPQTYSDFIFGLKCSIKSKLYFLRVYRLSLFRPIPFTTSSLYCLINSLNVERRILRVSSCYSSLFVSEKRLLLEKELQHRLVLYPLHVLPESSTLCLSDNYYEEDHIRHISSRLPIDAYLVVKENIHMLGHRNLSFYSRIKSLGNVLLLDPLVSVQHCLARKIFDAVVGISGTALLEAVLSGLCYVSAYGDPEFIDLLPRGYQGYAGVENMLSDFCQLRHTPDPALTPIEYINIITDLGISWNLPLDFEIDAKLLDSATARMLSCNIVNIIIRHCSKASSM